MAMYGGGFGGDSIASVDTAGEGYFIGVSIYIIKTDNNLIVAAVNQTRAFQFVLPFRAKVSNIITEVLTAGAAGKKYGVGLYDKDKNLLFKTAALDANSQTVQSDTLAASVTLEPGVYWFAQTCDDAATSFRVLPTETDQAFGPVNENTVRGGTAANNGTAGVLPATLGVITAATSREVAFTVFEP